MAALDGELVREERVHGDLRGEGYTEGEPAARRATSPHSGSAASTALHVPSAELAPGAASTAGGAQTSFGAGGGAGHAPQATPRHICGGGREHAMGTKSRGTTADPLQNPQHPGQ